MCDSDEEEDYLYREMNEEDEFYMGDSPEEEYYCDEDYEDNNVSGKINQPFNNNTVNSSVRRNSGCMLTIMFAIISVTCMIFIL